MSKPQSGLSRWRELFAYLVFGVMTTLLNIVLYALFQRLFGYEAANGWANVLDNLLCILFAYWTNRRWVFVSHTRGRQALTELGRFFGCRLGTMAADAVIMLVGGNLLRASGTALLLAAAGRWLNAEQALRLWGLGVKVFSNGVVIVLNYLFSKLIIFTDRGSEH